MGQPHTKEARAMSKERLDILTHNHHMAQEEARHKANLEIKSLFKKALMAFLGDRVMWFYAMQADSIYKTIWNTAKTLIEMEDYGSDEAWKYSISKRTYLLDTVLEAFEPPEIEVVEQSEPDDDKSSRKRLNMLTFSSKNNMCVFAGITCTQVCGQII